MLPAQYPAHYRRPLFGGDDSSATSSNFPKIHPFAALTKGLAGHELSEMGLLNDAGAIGLPIPPMPCRLRWFYAAP